MVTVVLSSVIQWSKQDCYQDENIHRPRDGVPCGLPQSLPILAFVHKVDKTDFVKRLVTKYALFCADF